jgi:hypothetical protein
MNKKLNFIIAEEPRALRTHQVADLCDYLTAKVLEPQFARAGHPWHRRFMNFFTFDNTSDPMESTGTIRFQVPALFAGQVGELGNAILQELSALGIKIGPVICESDPRHPQDQVLTIPIIENPTGLISPPDVNIGHTPGAIVLRDLLGYQPANGRYEFAADDLLKRVCSVTEDKIAAATASPLMGPEGVRRRPSAITMKSLKRCLDEIKQFALWATKHNYQALSAA